MGLYHAAERSHRADACPVCGAAPLSAPLVVHLNESHGPAESREPPRAPYPAFAWCVCRRADGRFLIVNEPAGMCASGRPGYWLPAGRLDAGETLAEAAARECLEEAGVAVRPLGLLRLMAEGDAPRVVRAALLVEPVGEGAAAKTVPDYESAGAIWARVEELSELGADDYRADTPAVLFPRVASGELRPLPLDTPAWVALEALLRRLTRGEGGALEELPAVWRRVRETYAAAFF
jgi:phosphatase NudJ